MLPDWKGEGHYHFPRHFKTQAPDPNPKPASRPQRLGKGDRDVGLLLPNMTLWPLEVKGSRRHEAGPGEVERQKL